MRLFIGVVGNNSFFVCELHKCWHFYQNKKNFLCFTEVLLIESKSIEAAAVSLSSTLNMYLSIQTHHPCRVFSLQRRKLGVCMSIIDASVGVYILDLYVFVLFFDACIGYSEQRTTEWLIGEAVMRLFLLRNLNLLLADKTETETVGSG